MNAYTLTLADTTVLHYARKDAAVKNGEKSGQDFTVKSPSGQVVFTKDTTPASAPTEAPAPEATEEENTVTEQATEQEQKQAPAKPEGYRKAGRPGKAPEAPETKKGETAVVYDVGNSAFAKVMLEGAAQVARTLGLDSAPKGQALILTGGDAKARTAAAKAIRQSWEDAYVKFNAWKKDQKATRREQVKTTEGRREMLAQERQFLADALAGDDVL